MSLENVILELTKVIEANTMALLAVESPAATAIAADTLKTAVAPVAAAVAAAAPVAAAPVVAAVAAAPVVAAKTADAPEPIISDVPYDGVDKEGVGWDERIHSSNGKKVKKSGLWMRKKGMAASNPEAQEIHKLLLQIAEAVAAGGPAPTPAPVVATVASPGGVVALVGVAAPIAAAPADIPAPLVFPNAANPNDLQHADLENVMAYFTEFHGQTMCAEILTQWNMSSMADLPANLYVDFYNYMIEQDAANK